MFFHLQGFWLRLEWLMETMNTLLGQSISGTSCINFIQIPIQSYRNLPLNHDMYIFCGWQHLIMSDCMTFHCSRLIRQLLAVATGNVTEWKRFVRRMVEIKCVPLYHLGSRIRILCAIKLLVCAFSMPSCYDTFHTQPKFQINMYCMRLDWK